MGRRGGPRGPYALGDGEDTGRVSHAATAVRAQLTRLEGDGRVRSAAIIADRFGLDPVTVLAERDPFKRLLRLAANNVVQNLEAKAQRKAGSGS